MQSLKGYFCQLWHLIPGISFYNVEDLVAIFCELLVIILLWANTDSRISFYEGQLHALSPGVILSNKHSTGSDQIMMILFWDLVNWVHLWAPVLKSYYKRGKKVFFQFGQTVICLLWIKWISQLEVSFYFANILFKYPIIASSTLTVVLFIHNSKIRHV